MMKTIKQTKVMEPKTIEKNGEREKGWLSKGNLAVLLLAIGLISVMFNSCNKNDENDSGEKYPTCDKIHATASSFTTLNVRIGYTYADYSGYSRLLLATHTLVNDTTSKSFIVAESEQNSKSQTFNLKNVPDEYLGNLIYDSYGIPFNNPETGLPYYYYKDLKSEGYKNFQLLQKHHISDSELQNINITNKNTKIAIILYGNITIYAKGKMESVDGLMTSTTAQMTLDYMNKKIECPFNQGDLVYSDSDCNITGYLTNYQGRVNLDIRLRKGWNKIFYFEDRIITTDNIDSHLIWSQLAG